MSNWEGIKNVKLRNGEHVGTIEFFCQLALFEHTGRADWQLDIKLVKEGNYYAGTHTKYYKIKAKSEVSWGPRQTTYYVYNFEAHDSWGFNDTFSSALESLAKAQREEEIELKQ
jgi:hypothetical protein